jgi:hypothetical protein
MREILYKGLIRGIHGQERASSDSMLASHGTSPVGQHGNPHNDSAGYRSLVVRTEEMRLRIFSVNTTMLSIRAAMMGARETGCRARRKR